MIQPSRVTRARNQECHLCGADFLVYPLQVPGCRHWSGAHLRDDPFYREDKGCACEFGMDAWRIPYIPQSHSRMRAQYWRDQWRRSMELDDMTICGVCIHWAQTRPATSPSWVAMGERYEYVGYVLSDAFKEKRRRGDYLPSTWRTCPCRYCKDARQSRELSLPEWVSRAMDPTMDSDFEWRKNALRRHYPTEIQPSEDEILLVL